MIIKDAQVNGRFYVSQVFNELILDQKVVLVKQVGSGSYHPVKSRKNVAALEKIVEQLRKFDE